MKRLKIASVAIAAAIGMAAGCRSVEVENYGQDYVKDADGNPILVDGKPVMYGKGWSVDHFQHWMMTDADAITANVRPQEIDFALNGLKSKPDSDGLANVVDKSLTGAATLAAKIGAAIATGGGSIGAEAIVNYVKGFMKAGGDADKATFDLSDGHVTITDGNITCVDGSCHD